jgi:hypothetical protein
MYYYCVQHLSAILLQLLLLLLLLVVLPITVCSNKRAHILRSSSCNLESLRAFSSSRCSCIAMNPPSSHPQPRLTLTSLPLDIYFCIQEFTSINALLNTSRRLDNIKHRLFHWKINTAFSKRFYSSEDFRATLMNLIYNSSKQLSLNFCGCQTVSDVSALGHVHTLYLSGCGNVSDVSALGHVHTLHLSHCRNVSDVSALGHVHTLDLSGCSNVSDVSALGHVHTLKLCACPNVSDVSALGYVHTLILSFCYKVSNVSALGHVHTLNLAWCIKVSDVSALGHVHTLIR